jgi:hypothetical protein
MENSTRQAIAAMHAALDNGQNVKIPALAKALNRARNTLYEAAKRNEFKVVKIGRSISVPPHEARRLLGLDDQAAA